jgi:hypothetical protein
MEQTHGKTWFKENFVHVLTPVTLMLVKIRLKTTHWFSPLDQRHRRP